MLELTERTKPGPFLPGTVELGGYLGIRREGRLVAMAGERMRPPGFAEISAVCTDEGWRGHGFAARLTRAVAAGIVARGETPFLHAAADNVNAIRLYKSLGFIHRRDVAFVAATVPSKRCAGPRPRHRLHTNPLDDGRKHGSRALPDHLPCVFGRRFPTFVPGNLIRRLLRR